MLITEFKEKLKKVLRKSGFTFSLLQTSNENNSTYYWTIEKTACQWELQTPKIGQQEVVWATEPMYLFRVPEIVYAHNDPYVGTGSDIHTLLVNGLTLKLLTCQDTKIVIVKYVF